MDAQVGRILDTLERSGKRKNTYVIFSADNGLAIGSHGLFGKQNMFEHSVKIPMIVVGPNLPKGERIDTPVYLQDVMPTTLEIAGRDVPEHVAFKSVLPIIRGEDSVAHNAAHNAIYGAYVDRQRMVRKGDFKLIVYPKGGTVFLFDLKNDPAELDNLADRPEHASTLAELKTELVKLQIETGDPTAL